MKCFYHPSVDAVGVCKSCGKGLCLESAVDLGQGLACRNRCEEHATSLIKLIDDNIKRASIHNQIVDSAKKNRYWGSAFPIVMGLFFLSFGSYQLFTTEFESFNLFLPGLGALFLFFGSLSLYRAITFARARN